MNQCMVAGCAAAFAEGEKVPDGWTHGQRGLASGWRCPEHTNVEEGDALRPDGTFSLSTEPVEGGGAWAVQMERAGSLEEVAAALLAEKEQRKRRLEAMAIRLVPTLAERLIFPEGQAELAEWMESVARASVVMAMAIQEAAGEVVAQQAREGGDDPVAGTD